MKSECSQLEALTLSAVERAAYLRDGFFVRRAVFGETELVALRAAAESAQQAAREATASGHTYWLDGNRFVDCGHITVQFEHAQASTTVRVIEPVHELDGRLAQLLDDRRLVQPMCALLGSDHVSLWTDKLNLKRPREGSGFGWHQDSPYWIHDSPHVDQLPNVMLNFDATTVANGCLRVIRGSHVRGVLPGRADGTQLEGFYTNADQIDDSQVVDLCLPAGSLAFFSPHIIHGSQPNASNEPRRALIATYQPAGFSMLKAPGVRTF